MSREGGFSGTMETAFWSCSFDVVARYYLCHSGGFTPTWLQFSHHGRRSCNSSLALRSAVRLALGTRNLVSSDLAGLLRTVARAYTDLLLEIGIHIAPIPQGAKSLRVPYTPMLCIFTFSIAICIQPNNSLGYDIRYFYILQSVADWFPNLQVVKCNVCCFLR